MHVFGLWEEAGVPGGNPSNHVENMQTLLTVLTTKYVLPWTPVRVYMPSPHSQTPSEAAVRQQRYPPISLFNNHLMNIFNQKNIYLYVTYSVISNGCSRPVLVELVFILNSYFVSVLQLNSWCCRIIWPTPCIIITHPDTLSLPPSLLFYYSVTFAHTQTTVW